jgi:hypothetical protein
MILDNLATEANDCFMTRLMILSPAEDPRL